MIFIVSESIDAEVYSWIIFQVSPFCLSTHVSRLCMAQALHEADVAATEMRSRIEHFGSLVLEHSHSPALVGGQERVALKHTHPNA